MSPTPSFHSRLMNADFKKPYVIVTHTGKVLSRRRTTSYFVVYSCKLGTRTT